MDGPVRALVNRTGTIGGLSISGAAGAVVTTNLYHATAAFGQGVGVLRFGDAVESSIQIALGIPAALIIGGHAEGSSLKTTNAIGTLVLKEFAGTSVNAVLDARRIGNFVVAGELSATVNITGDGTSIGTLRAATIENTTLRCDSGGIQAIISREIRGSNLLFGAGPDELFNPQSPAAASKSSVIGRIQTLKFINSNLVAGQIGVASLGLVTAENGSTPFGLFARKFGIVVGRTSITGKLIRAAGIHYLNDATSCSDFTVRDVGGDESPYSYGSGLDLISDSTFAS